MLSALFAWADNDSKLSGMRIVGHLKKHASLCVVSKPTNIKIKESLFG